jgi:uncharacterized membrane protein HdeD (DUF308 family)
MPNLITKVENDIKHWWTFLVAGVLLIIMGILVYAFPIIFYVSLSWIMGTLISVEGIIHVFFAVENRKKLHSWGWMLTTGCLELLLGCILFFYPGVTIVTVPLLVGFWLIIRGISLVSYSIDLKKHHADTWGWLLTGGILTLLFALLMIFNPLIGALFIVLWTGIGFIIAGIFNIMLAFHFRKFSDEISPDIIAAEDTAKKVL